MQLICFRSAELQEQGRLRNAQASLARMFTAQRSRALCREARDMLGGDGLLIANHVARHLADMEVVHNVRGHGLHLVPDRRARYHGNRSILLRAARTRPFRHVANDSGTSCPTTVPTHCVQNVSKTRGELSGIAKTPVDARVLLTLCG